MGISVVTGGAGFIGSNLAQRLLELGERVRIVDNFLTGRRENIAGLLERYPEELELIEGDIRDIRLLCRAFAGARYVYHQAALPSVQRSVEDPILSNDINVAGTLNILTAARGAGIARVIYASSSSVYGDSPTLPKRESMPARPISPYGLTKLVGEEYCRLFYSLYGLETVSLRYFNVFGPRQDPGSEYAAVIPRFISKMLSGQPPIIYGDGEQTRDFTFVENVVEANLLASRIPAAAGECFNIACGEQQSLKQLVAILNELLGTSYAPVHTDPRPGDIRHSLADVNKARRLLDYSPAIDLREGLKKSIDWYRENSAARAGF